MLIAERARLDRAHHRARDIIRVVARVAFIGALTVAMAGLRIGAQDRWRSLDDFLVRAVGLAAPQLATLARGEAVSKILPTSDTRDVAVFGAVQVDVPRALFIARQASFPAALQAPGRRAVGLFGAPATVENLRALEIGAEDLRRLRACRVESCDFKLPATDMDWLRTSTDWDAPDAAAVVGRYARRRLVDLVNDYARRGNVAMAVYDDRRTVRGSDAFAELLRDSTYAYRIAPSLARHLLEYPRDSLVSATDVMFWSVDEMPGVRPTLRIMHELVYSPPELPGTTIVAIKQVYANHYFEAGLELLSALDRVPETSSSSASSITLVAIRRYRFDNLPDGGPLDLRGRVMSGLRDQLAADLKRLKAEYERAQRARGGP
jgi:hypothetical protein